MKGDLNIYVCAACRGHIVTRDRDEGTTPMFVACRATPLCKGTMQSSMYRVFDQTMAEGFEWYRPLPLERAALSESLQHHVSLGGLLLRKVTTPAPLARPPAAEDRLNAGGAA